MLLSNEERKSGKYSLGNKPFPGGDVYFLLKGALFGHTPCGAPIFIGLL